MVGKVTTFLLHALRTHAIPEHFRGVITTRCCTNLHLHLPLPHAYVTCALCIDCLETGVTFGRYSHIESYFHYSWLSVIVIPSIVGAAASLGGESVGLLIIVIPSVVGTVVSLGGEGLGLLIIVIPRVVGTAVSLGGEGLGLMIIIIPSVVGTAVSLGGEGLSGNWIVER